MFLDLAVRDFLDRAELVYPDRVGVVDEPRQPAPSWGSVTYRDMARLARAQAAGLDALGVPAGGRVAIVSQNAARMLVSFFGVSGWGRVLVPINFRLTPGEVDYILRDSGTEVLLLDPELEHLGEATVAKHVLVLGRDDGAVFDEAREPVDRPTVESATATLNYTSGTTARPKGVQLTHRNLWINAVVFGLHLALTDDDVLLHTLPMFHANGWGLPYALTGVGGRHVVLRKVDGGEILRRIDRHGVTVLCGAPAVVSAVLDAAAHRDGPVPGWGRVRAVVAGAPPPTRLIERMHEELGWEFIQIYGLTETSPLLTVNRMREEWRGLDGPARARRLRRAGAPALGVRLRIDDDGEVLARTNHNLEAYWGKPAETAHAQAGGWFHTGDGGTLTDGYLTLSDRKKDVIISGGENVSSIEVEDVLTAHPAVREAAVIGVPDETWGELVTAIVVLEGGACSADDLVAHCRERLAGFKCPKRVEFTDALPRTATGKVQKYVLREPFWRGREDRIS
ncbi:class I adenylate-forming enzyme family protein [Pseudonocardia sp. RS010]|uniref:class I adenylate-forming enzyme family protein n=1 Tax=Pseudonocardia sp. RS010 TaxID=3385979 RepID=UPI0039A234AE